MEVKLNHTKGPWGFSRTHMASSDTWYVITYNNGYGPIVDVGGKDKFGQIAEAKYLITNPIEIEANARLISASTKMLKLLIKELQQNLKYMNSEDIKFLKENLNNDLNKKIDIVEEATGKSINELLRYKGEI